MLARSLLDFDLDSIVSIKRRDGVFKDSPLLSVNSERGTQYYVLFNRNGYTKHGRYYAESGREDGWDIVYVEFDDGSVLDTEGYYPRGTKEVKEKTVDNSRLVGELSTGKRLDLTIHSSLGKKAAEALVEDLQGLICDYDLNNDTDLDIILFYRDIQKYIKKAQEGE